MKILDVLGMGLRNLLRRKTRTFLTVIGVVVGATAIILMLSLGIGMNEQLNRSIENMGDLTMIEVYEYAYNRPPGGDDDEWVQSQNVLDEALLEKIRTWDGVLAVTPYINHWNMTMHAGKNYETFQSGVTGIDSSFLPYLKIETLEGGQMPQAGDENWILFGARRARQFYDARRADRMRQRDWNALYEPDMESPPKVNILKEKIYLKNRTDSNWVYNQSTGMYEERQIRGRMKEHTVNIVGLIAYNPVDNGYGWSYDEHEWQAYADYKIVIAIIKELEKATGVKPRDSRADKFDNIRIKVKDIKTSEIIQEKLGEEGIMLNYGLAEIRDEMQQTQNTMQMILGGIGAMSLLVAAIGIANTMFMSIYERTKEIGVMKVLGCPLGGIKSMFLFEASIIGFCGGLLGVGISLIGSYSLNNVDAFKQALGNISGGGRYYYGGGPEQGDISVIPLWLIAMAIIFATVIGLASGYLPARRATKISALEAIRNE